MATCYRYNGTDCSSIPALRRAMPNVSLPASPSDESLVALGVVIYEVEPEKPDLEELKERKTYEIRLISEQKIRAMQGGYTLGEINTFEQQYDGAVEILANGITRNITTMSEDAQFVIGLAHGRSEFGGVEVTPEELSLKIVTNYNSAKEYTLKILSIQQGLETKARMATSREELQAITWPDSV